MKQFTIKDMIAFGKYLGCDLINASVVAEWQKLNGAVDTLTKGQQIMSVTFNPGQREDVANIKQVFADAYDEIDTWMESKAGQVSEAHRLAAIAKTNLETAQMYAVKAVTR